MRGLSPSFYPALRDCTDVYQCKQKKSLAAGQQFLERGLPSVVEAYPPDEVFSPMFGVGL